MSVCLDASVLVSMFVRDALSKRANAAIERTGSVLVVSNLAAAEFVSALGRRVRMGALTLADARGATASFDAWAESVAEQVAATVQDFSLCDSYLRRFDLPLRTPDGLHIAIASRLRASILSFDKQLAASAKKLGVPVARA